MKTHPTNPPATPAGRHARMVQYVCPVCLHSEHFVTDKFCIMCRTPLYLCSGCVHEGKDSRENCLQNCCRNHIETRADLFEPVSKEVP